jgi:geranylgeranyl pyrophosphate synthase
LIDDMLDFTASSAMLGKPSSGADLKLGLATAPALYAWEEHPEMGQLIQRKFDQPGDVDKVRRRHYCSPANSTSSNRLEALSLALKGPSGPAIWPRTTPSWPGTRWSTFPTRKPAPPF